MPRFSNSFPRVLSLAELFASIPAVMSELNSLFFELPPTDAIAGIVSRIESSLFPRNLIQRDASSRGCGGAAEQASRGSSLRSGGIATIINDRFVSDDAKMRQFRNALHVGD